MGFDQNLQVNHALQHCEEKWYTKMYEATHVSIQLDKDEGTFNASCHFNRKH